MLASVSCWLILFNPVAVNLGVFDQSMNPPPIDAAEFEAHKDLSDLIIQFLCRNQEKGFSAKEIGDAVGLKEGDVNNSLLKLSFSDIFGELTGGLISRKHTSSRDKESVKIEDVTIDGVIYYRCVSKRS